VDTTAKTHSEDSDRIIVIEEQNLSSTPDRSSSSYHSWQPGQRKNYAAVAFCEILFISESHHKIWVWIDSWNVALRKHIQELVSNDVTMKDIVLVGDDDDVDAEDISSFDLILYDEAYIAGDKFESYENSLPKLN
jgi:hypothetical protein